MSFDSKRNLVPKKYYKSESDKRRNEALEIYKMELLKWVRNRDILVDTKTGIQTPWSLGERLNLDIDDFLSADDAEGSDRVPNLPSVLEFCEAKPYTIDHALQFGSAVKKLDVYALVLNETLRNKFVIGYQDAVAGGDTDVVTNYEKLLDRIAFHVVQMTTVKPHTVKLLRDLIARILNQDSQRTTVYLNKWLMAHIDLNEYDNIGIGRNCTQYIKLPKKDQLENKTESYIDYLRTELGIYNFIRYPYEYLTELRQKAESDAPSVLFAIARNDYVGVLASAEENIKDAETQIKGYAAVISLEVGSFLKLLSILIKEQMKARVVLLQCS